MDRYILSDEEGIRQGARRSRRGASIAGKQLIRRREDDAKAVKIKVSRVKLVDFSLKRRGTCELERQPVDGDLNLVYVRRKYGLCNNNAA